MKTSLAIALALSTGVGATVFAQNVKQDIITIALSGQEQVSVSDTTANNAGTFSAGPKYYKTGATKVTDQNIIQYIAFIKHGSATYYAHAGKNPQLVLVQGELTGFFNITPDLGGSATSATFETPDFDDNGELDGGFTTADGDTDTTIANSLDSTFVVLDSGRHMTNNPITGLFPVGNNQPWGQIFVQYYNSDDELECDNVTYYFALSVEECFDCFYMNSFISDATFKEVTGTQVGPPCCSVSTVIEGKGKDRYYLTLSFDNTYNNPYLDSDSSCWASDNGFDAPGGPVGSIPGDAIDPDALKYSDLIASGLGKPEPFEARFTLNGIMSYTWTLGYLNKSDIAPDFLGTGSYTANGYGFVGLICNLFTGTATFSEKMVKAGTCCEDFYNWYDWWYGIGAEYVDTEGGPETLYYIGTSTGATSGYPTPVNGATSLTYHENFNRGGYDVNTANFAPSAWPTPGVLTEPWDNFGPLPY